MGSTLYFRAAPSLLFSLAHFMAFSDHSMLFALPFNVAIQVAIHVHRIATYMTASGVYLKPGI